MQLIDIGANLTHDSFDADRDEVIRRAASAGVSGMILTGSSENGSRRAADLAETMPGRMWSTAGVHPHHAADYSETAEETLRELLQRDAVVAVGECGLDYFRNFSPKKAQKDAFQRQLELAMETGLPVFLHQRDAHDDFIAMLQPVIGKISRAVAHCFTGGPEELEKNLDLGLYIGITGWICDERRGAALRESVALAPLDKLMVETDAPYLLPRTLDPKPKTRRNEPMYLGEVVRAVAAAMQRPEEEIAAASSANAKRFFALPCD